MALFYLKPERPLHVFQGYVRAKLTERYVSDTPPPQYESAWMMIQRRQGHGWAKPVPEVINELVKESVYPVFQFATNNRRATPPGPSRMSDLLTAYDGFLERLHYSPDERGSELRRIREDFPEPISTEFQDPLYLELRTEGLPGLRLLLSPRSDTWKDSFVMHNAMTHVERN